MKDRPNWLHLDCKGTMPSVACMCQWLDWFAEQGFDAIVWEYEDRLPWNAWTGTFKPGYTLEQWQQIWTHCRKLGLGVVPLVQTLGHLEWLLRHDTYAHLRENNQLNAVCPQHPEVMPRLLGWLDEVIDLHEETEFVHLGLDEVWNLRTCDTCANVAEQSSQGPMHLYVEHVIRLCDHVIALGKRPMIWADMFCNHAAMSLASNLPDEAVLVDWDYRPVPEDHVEALKATGRRVWGASAIRSGFEQKHTLAQIGPRLANISQWQRELTRDSIAGLIHTTWARSNSLRPINGPWDGWLPAFVAAGNQSRWDGHILKGLIEPLDEALVAPESTDLTETIGRIESTRCDDPMVHRCLEWWVLAMRHRKLFWATVEHTIGCFGMEAVERHRGPADPFLALLRGDLDSDIPIDPVRRMFGDISQLHRALAEWERAARAFWEARELSDADEYFASRADNLRRTLELVRGPGSTPG